MAYSGRVDDAAGGVLNADDITAVAALEDESRRTMFEFIRRTRRPVTRDEAAEHAGISRKLAAFHLERLVDVGLLEVARATGPRRVGRAPKAYVCTRTDVVVRIPERQHEVLAAILIDAISGAGVRDTPQRAAFRSARRHGVEIGANELRPRAGGGRISAERALTITEPALAAAGYEPERVSPRCIRLRSCPFHPVTGRSPELVCGLNQQLIEGILEGLEAAAVEAVLDPAPGECCVELRARESRN